MKTALNFGSGVDIAYEPVCFADRCVTTPPRGPYNAGSVQPIKHLGNRLPADRRKFPKLRFRLISETAVRGSFRARLFACVLRGDSNG